MALNMEFMNCSNLCDEISSVIGTHRNQFTTKVSWRNYSAEGTADNKKEAKQNAAKKMLSLLLLSNEIPEKILLSIPNMKTDFKLNNSVITNDVCSVNSSDSDTTKFMNYVGLLNEYCQGHNLSSPVYENVGMTGPSHLPMFTVSCAIDSIRQEGCANTKQAAKHQAAKKVLENLENKPCSNVKFNTKTSDMDNLNVQFMKVSVDEPKYDKLQEQKIIATYGQIRKKPVLFKPRIKINDYVEVLRDLCYNISMKDKNSLSKVYNTSFSVDSDTLKVIIYRAFKTTIEEISFNTINGDSLIGLKLDTHPVIFQCGIGRTKEQATKNALHKLLEYIFLLLQ
ncbi:interferon-inducible double-stranded RNA-dependent protein kinase activator A homolog isoform X2 [Megachile rotundata]|uniref:interferon-inducible double-stranded RNA-dependent protein kinase activator A homolog isoform X2 n=1 Tax=Megachile rotundata TaxID=143995 RepID=UPI000614F56F|nr:PREDICTED: interferon-inducible double-stranded RNA-dependent protein kinase activator A homolog isoform X2 [Megachile rotundata]